MANKTLIGQSLGKYKIVDVLGRGGMAEVFRAYQENLDRYVAVKVMHAFLADEENFLARFQREAKAMASLNHNNIVGVYDFDVQDEMYYIVMEYVSGGTLKKKLTSLSAEGKQIPLSETVQSVLEIADALAYAHSRGMVHRDIKPGNIMIDESGHAVLTDFGIAKILSGPTVTATGAMIGTPAYMSPEQGLGQPGDERSDLYALGVLFYQMVTGVLPYDADTPLAVILKHVNEPVPRPIDMNPNTPQAIQAVIVKAMAKDPNERYQSAFEFIDALTAAAASSDLTLAAGVVYGASRDTPTQPPVAGVQATQIAPAGATSISPGAAGAVAVGATRIATSDQIMATEIAAPVPPAPPVTPAKKRTIWPIILVVLLFLILAGAAGGFVVFGGGGDDPTPMPTEVVAVVPEDTPTEAPTDTATPEPGPTADNVSTAVARIAETLTAQPTEIILPTATTIPTETPTPDATATFLAGCEEDVELVNSYTFQNEDTSSVPVGVTFGMNWEIRNSGDCPLPAGLLWTYQEGEEFEQEDPVELEDDLFAGDEALLQTLLVAPNRTGTYNSSWQFEDADGNGVGPALEFEILVFVPQTPTPRATSTPAVSPTAAGPFGYNLNIGNCVDVDEGDWECTVSIIPFGGVGPYTVLVSDDDPPSQYNGSGPFFHVIRSRRCDPWVNTFTMQDDGTGQTFTESKFYDPKALFGCVNPQ
jgi:serine/threonine-protein kinase